MKFLSCYPNTNTRYGLKFLLYETPAAFKVCLASIHLDPKTFPSVFFWLGLNITPKNPFCLLISPKIDVY
ncbi:unnamed protein product [Lathyrus sativus]|nr:unnamed protein product [Lathyrus sativus]